MAPSLFDYILPPFCTSALRLHMIIADTYGLGACTNGQ